MNSEILRCEDPLDRLELMQTYFQQRAEVYQLAHKKWRTWSFRLAATMGLLPVFAGVTHLLPEALMAWVAILISVTNVLVVVAHVNLNIGERTADAGMAMKGYAKLACDISFHFSGGHTDTKEYEMFMVQTRSVVENIEANINYPEKVLVCKLRSSPALRRATQSFIFDNCTKNVSDVSTRDISDSLVDATNMDEIEDQLGRVTQCSSDSARAMVLDTEALQQSERLTLGSNVLGNAHGNQPKVAAVHNSAVVLPLENAASSNASTVSTLQHPNAINANLASSRTLVDMQGPPPLVLPPPPPPPMPPGPPPPTPGATWEISGH